MQLPLAGLAEIIDLPLHVFDVGDLVVTLLGGLSFLFGVQRWRLQLLVQVIDLIQYFLVGVSPIGKFLLSSVSGVVQFRVRLFLPGILIKRAPHIDGSDF